MTFDGGRAALVERFGQRAVDAIDGVLTVCETLSYVIGTDRDAFVADVRTQWAAEMGLIRIGEGVNRIPDLLLAEFPDQPWRQIVAMRDVAAHQYDDLDPGRVWRTVTADVPALHRYLADVVLAGEGPAPDAGS